MKNSLQTTLFSNLFVVTDMTRRKDIMMEINSNSLFYQVRSDVSKQQAVSGITITQLDLREGTTSMGPSVSDSERHRYQAM